MINATDIEAMTEDYRVEEIQDIIIDIETFWATHNLTEGQEAEIISSINCLERLKVTLGEEQDE